MPNIVSQWVTFKAVHARLHVTVARAGRDSSTAGALEKSRKIREEREKETDRDADGRPRYRADDQGSDPRCAGDDPRSRRRRRPLCGYRDFGVLPWQVSCPAAPDRLSVVARPDGRDAARIGAADRRAGGLTGS